MMLTALTRFLAIFALTVGAAAADDHDVIRAHGISSFGDLKYPADFLHFDYVNPDAPKGGVWSGRGSGASGTFDSLNPFILKGNPAQGLGVTFDSLLSGTGDEVDSAYGLIAHTIVYPKDRSWVIFEMRPEATFADGSPITAEDVKFSFDILIEKGHPAYKQVLRAFNSPDVIDDHTVKFTFKEGFATRDLPAQAGGISIMSKAFFETRDFAESSLEPILASGAYTVGEIEPGKSITYERNPDYWAKDLPVNVGTGNFDKLRFEYYGDYTAAFEAFKSGQYLFHEEFFSKIWATGYDFPALTDEKWVVKDSIPDGRPSGTQGFWMNMRRERLQDPRVRQAIALAFDFEWSNDKLFYGLYTRTDSFWENSPMQAEGMPSEAELALLEPLRADLPEAVFTDAAYVPPETNRSGADRRVLRRARRLLDDAGWTVGDDGMRRNAAGETLTLEILDDSPTFERIIGPYIEVLRQIGVDASLRLVDKAQYQERQKAYDYDMIPGRLVMSLSPGPSLLNYFSTEAADRADSANFSGVKNPAVDSLLETIIAAENREDLTVAIKALDRVLRAMHIWTPNWFKASHNISYWDVFGRPDVKPTYTRGVIGLWWWDEEKAAALKASGAPAKF